MPPVAPQSQSLECEHRTEPELTAEEALRYGRHLMLPEMGADGQRRLRAARVLCVGMGGLGSPLAMYLAAAGVGTLGIVDYDVVEYTNLQRQIIHGTADVGKPKLDSAVRTLQDINPLVKLVRFDTPLTSDNALQILADFDVIVDGTDNFPTRYLVNDACVLLGKPNVYGSVLRFEGQASVFWTPKGPCYRCLFPAPPPPGSIPSCADAGVLGVLPGVIGTLQATETIKLILGIGDSLVGRLLRFDALKMRWRELRVAKDRNCPVCGERPTISDLTEYERSCCPSDLRDIEADPSATTVQALKARLDRGERLTIIDVREPHELQIAVMPNAVNIPLNDLLARAGELDPEAEIILVCRSGSRAMKALQMLRSQGFRNLRNLTGGILAWSEHIDPTIPKY